MSEIPVPPEQVDPQELLRNFDPRSDSISADLIAAVPTSGFLHAGQRGRTESLGIRASRGVLRENLINGTFLAAKRRGVVSWDKPFSDFLTREVIVIYSEVFGGKRFIFDVETGKRMFPDDALPRDGLGDDLTDPAVPRRIFNELKLSGALDEPDGTKIH